MGPRRGPGVPGDWIRRWAPPALMAVLAVREIRPAVGPADPYDAAAMAGLALYALRFDTTAGDPPWRTANACDRGLMLVAVASIALFVGKRLAGWL